MADPDKEKHPSSIDHNDSHDREHPVTGLLENNVAVGEAAALYGDLETAESMRSDRQNA